MSFKKILLASAIAAASSASFAMEAMDDSAMSDTTGQDGLTISLATTLSLDMYIHDTDGFTGATDSGAIGMKGIGMTNTTGGNVGLAIVIDAGAAVASAPVLQVGISTTTGTVLDLGTVTVANSNRTTAGGSWGVTNETAAVMDLGSLSFAATTNLLNIQMGNETQGAWMKVGATFTGGLAITGFALNDTGGALNGGGIGGNLTVTNRSSADLNADLSIDATTSGLIVTVNQLGTAGGAGVGGMNVRLADMKMGNLAGATQVGDIEIIGLNLNGTTITVAGH